MGKPIKTIILDDEPFAVRLLNDYATKVPSLEVIYSGGDAFRVLELLNEHTTVLVFIDLQMPKLSGMEIMEMTKNDQHNFIITSAYPEYALEAFKFKVVDFVVKPITFHRFYESVEKFLSWQKSLHISSLGGSETEELFIRAERKIYRIHPREIVYIEGLKDYIRIHTEDEKIIAHENMKDFLVKLPSNFLRIHRSYIVPSTRIKMLDGNSIYLRDNIRLPIGETYRKKVKQKFE